MKRLLGAVLAVILFVPQLGAATQVGSVVVTSTSVGAGLVRYDIAWTCNASGAVSGNILNIKKGYLIQAQFVPGSGGTQPSDLYDVVLNDVSSVDYLIAGGANVSNNTSKLIQYSPVLYYDGVGILDLVISNAGNAKTGTFILWIGSK